MADDPAVDDFPEPATVLPPEESFGFATSADVTVEAAADTEVSL
jgi:hypothetical protein